MKNNRISVLYLGTKGAGPVYSLEMCKALMSEDYALQIFISSNNKNKHCWYDALSIGSSIIEINTYKHSYLSLILSFTKIKSFFYIYNNIKKFKPSFVYLPFGLIWSPVIFRLLKGKLRIVATIHDVELHPERGLIKRLVKSFYFLLHKDYARMADDIIILNNMDIQKAKLLSNNNSICVIPHACFNHYNMDYSISTKTQYTIGFFGRIEYYKGIDLLLTAFDNLQHNIKLIIAGNGIMPLSVHEKIMANDKIILINRWIEDSEFKELFSQVDFIVLPYRFASQSGIIPLSFSFGKPVITTNVGALKEQVPDGCGIVVEPDSEQIAHAIDSLYIDKERLLSMSNSVFDYSQRVLTWKSSVKKLLMFLK